MPLFEFGPDQPGSSKAVHAPISGDGKGRCFVHEHPIDMEPLEFPTGPLNLEFTTGKAEQRISAVFGIQPGTLVAGLGTGLRRRTDRASMKSAIDLTFKAFVIPFLRKEGPAVHSLAYPGTREDRRGDALRREQNRNPEGCFA